MRPTVDHVRQLARRRRAHGQVTRVCANNPSAVVGGLLPPASQELSGLSARRANNTSTILLLLALTSSVAMKIEPLKTKIDPVKCMGNWYVQVAVPTPLDSGASNGLEQYSWDAEKERVSVVYDFDTPKGKKMTVQQIGGVTDKEFGTTWWVKPKIGFFYLPFKLPYLVIDVDTENYQWLTASSPKTTGIAPWLYIMTRDQVVTDEYLAPRIALAEQRAALELVRWFALNASQAVHLSSSSFQFIQSLQTEDTSTWCTVHALSTHE